MADPPVPTPPSDDFAGEGETVYKDGVAYTIKNGQPVPMGNPQSLSGDAKAFGTGVLHDFLPGVVGAPADLTQAAKGWWNDLKPAPAGATLPEPQPEGASTEGKVPSSPGMGGGDFTSAGVDKTISDVIPRHVAANETEKALETAGTVLPSALLGPEAATLKGAALNTVKYGVAPTAASTAVGALSDHLGLSPQYSDWAQTAAALGSPILAHKAITPFPVTPETLAGSQPLRDVGVRMSPGQFTGDPNRMETDAKLANTFGTGTSSTAQNAQTADSLTRGALRTAFGDSDPIIANSTNASTGLARASANNDNEFTRLTNTYGLPYSTQMKNGMQQVISDYKANNVTGDASPLEDYLKKFEDGIAPQGDILQGRQYQNERSTLSGNSADAPNASLGRAWGQMRDALDQGMRDRIQYNVNAGTAPPNEVNAFDKARNDYQSLMILKRAAGDPKSAGTDNINPTKLASATRQVVSPGSDDWKNHPLGRYAIAAENHASPLPNASSPLLHEFGPLGTTLGAGAVGASLAGGHGMEAVGDLGYLGPAATVAALKAAKIPWGAAIHSDLARPYILNQLIPKGSALSSPARNVPPSIAETAAILNKQRQQQQ